MLIPMQEHMEEPGFNRLRTKMLLGYDVSISHKLYGVVSTNISVTSQASSLSGLWGFFNFFWKLSHHNSDGTNWIHNIW